MSNSKKTPKPSTAKKASTSTKTKSATKKVVIKSQPVSPIITKAAAPVAEVKPPVVVKVVRLSRWAKFKKSFSKS